MSDQQAPEQPQIYLVTPPDLELSRFPATLARVLDRVEVACLRLSLSSTDEDQIARTADLLRLEAHARDIPLILDRHFRLVEKLGLDGVHLTDGARSVRSVRKELGGELVVGSFCGTSRHEGLNAGEIGCDYISFGPLSDTGLGDAAIADFETFDWWSQMIELPIVAEGALDIRAIETLAPVTDFFAIGQEIWAQDDPAGALAALTAPLN
ncbi:MAG: thiamine phosphate synthase [Pseudomonadota bacterium]